MGRKNRNDKLLHQDLAYVHQSVHLILFSRLCEEDKVLKMKLFHIGTVVGVAEPEQKVENLPILSESDHLFAYFKFWRGKTPRMQSKIDCVNFEVNIITRLEGNIRIWCANCNFPCS